MLSHWEKKKKKENKTNPETKSQAGITVWEQETTTAITLEARNTLPGDDDCV